MYAILKRSMAKYDAEIYTSLSRKTNINNIARM